MCDYSGTGTYIMYRGTKNTAVHILFLFLCSRWSFVDVPLILSRPTDHKPDWQPRIILGMVKARWVNNMKNITSQGVEDNLGIYGSVGISYGDCHEDVMKSTWSL